MRSSTARFLGLALLLVALCAAATVFRSAGAARRIDDLWNEKIAAWQERARAAVGGTTSPVASDRGDDGIIGSRRGAHADGAPAAATLRSEYETFRATRRRALAADVTRWVQREAVHHYRSDAPGDEWPTISETLDRNGDDCDGLELIAYSLLRDLGFGERNVYRAVVRRRSDSLHHMVTMWLEDSTDPWVIDPTGIMAPDLMRLSDLRGWVPVKLFSETETFTPERGRFPGKLSPRSAQTAAGKACEPATDAVERARDVRKLEKQRAGQSAPARG